MSIQALAIRAQVVLTVSLVPTAGCVFAESESRDESTGVQSGADAGPQHKKPYVEKVERDATVSGDAASPTLPPVSPHAALHSLSSDAGDHESPPPSASLLTAGRRIDLGHGNFVTLNPHTLDNQLLNLPVGGPTGRYTIGARSLTLAHAVIGRGPTRVASMSEDEIQALLISAAAWLIVEKNPALVVSRATADGTSRLMGENHNVAVAGQALVGYSGREPTVSVKTNDLVLFYRLLKAGIRGDIAPSTPPVTPPAPTGGYQVHLPPRGPAVNTFQVLRTQSERLFEQLKNKEHRKVAFVYTVPSNGIPYVLLVRNSAGLYEFPTAPNGVDFMAQLGGILGAAQPIVNHNFGNFNTPANVIIAHPSLDQLINRHRHTTHRDDYIFVRAVNLEQLRNIYEYDFEASEYARIDPAGHFFVHVGAGNRGDFQLVEGDYRVEPNVLITINWFVGLRGHLARVGDVNLDDIVREISGQGQAAPGGSLLSAAQTAAIRGVYEAAKKGIPTLPDPKRPGNDFIPVERGIATAITLIAPNGEAGFTEALEVVFSKARAKAILDAIVEGAD